jgi:hypothetical protein
MAAVDRDPTTVSPTPAPAPSIAPAGVPKYVLDYGKKFERGVFKLVSRLGSTVLFKILQAASVYFTVYKTYYALSCQEVFPSDGFNFSLPLIPQAYFIAENVLFIDSCLQMFGNFYHNLLFFISLSRRARI